MGRVKIEDPSEDVELLVHNSQSVGYGGVTEDLSQGDGGPTVITIFFCAALLCGSHLASIRASFAPKTSQFDEFPDSQSRGPLSGLFE